MASKPNYYFILVQKVKVDDYSFKIVLVEACVNDSKVISPEESLIYKDYDQKGYGSPECSECARMKMFNFVVEPFLYMFCADMASFVNRLRKIMRKPKILLILLVLQPEIYVLPYGRRIRPQRACEELRVLVRKRPMI